MKKYLVILFAFFFLSPSSFSQKTDAYYVKFISGVDSSEMSFIGISAIVADTMQAGWITDVDGVIKIRPTEIHPQAQLRTSTVEYKTFYFSLDRLSLNDTIVFLLEAKPVTINEITITSYRIIMDPDVSTKKKKKVKKKVEVIETNLYTMDQYTLMDSLITGDWFKARPKGMGAGFQDYINYLQTEIKYPQYAREHRIEERIYFRLKFGEKGNIEQIVLVKANSPILALAAAEVLVKISRLVPKDEFEQYPKKGSEIYLPVNFKLE